MSAPLPLACGEDSNYTSTASDCLGRATSRRPSFCVALSYCDVTDNLVVIERIEQTRLLHLETEEFAHLGAHRQMAAVRRALRRLKPASSSAEGRRGFCCDHVPHLTSVRPPSNPVKQIGQGLKANVRIRSYELKMHLHAGKSACSKIVGMTFTPTSHAAFCFQWRAESSCCGSDGVPLQKARVRNAACHEKLL
jgi:hypothetical protein